MTTATLALKESDFTQEVASLWGDLLDLGRPATFEEASDDFAKGVFGGSPADYFDAAGKYKGPCALGLSIVDLGGKKK